MAKKYVVASGSAFNGIELFGPFDGFDAALTYAEEGRAGYPGSEWEVVPLTEIGEVSDG